MHKIENNKPPAPVGIDSKKETVTSSFLHKRTGDEFRPNNRYDDIFSESSEDPLPGEPKTPGVPVGASPGSAVPRVKTSDLAPLKNAILPDSKEQGGIVPLTTKALYLHNQRMKELSLLSPQKKPPPPKKGAI